MLQFKPHKITLKEDQQVGCLLGQTSTVIYSWPITGPVYRSRRINCAHFGQFKQLVFLLSLLTSEMKVFCFVIFRNRLLFFYYCSFTDTVLGIGLLLLSDLYSVMTCNWLFYLFYLNFMGGRGGEWGSSFLSQINSKFSVTTNPCLTIYPLMGRMLNCYLLSSFFQDKSSGNYIFCCLDFSAWTTVKKKYC